MVDSIDQLGPVDYLVVEFPGSNFNGEIMPELVDLVQRGIIRVLDLVLIKKEEDGSYDALEFDEIEDSALGDLREFERELADVLSEEDIISAADALEPGSTAGLLVYENLWAAPFASAVRRSGGQLVADGRIPVQALLAVLEHEIDTEIEAEIDSRSPKSRESDDVGTTTNRPAGSDCPGSEGHRNGRHRSCGHPRSPAPR